MAVFVGPGYPPLDVVKPVAPDVFLVDSLLPGVIGRVLAVRMAVIRLPNGDLLLHSPTRFSPALAAALAVLGPINHLVAPNGAHWMFLQGWQERLPGAETWAAPGLARRRPVRRSGVRFDHALADGLPLAWGGAVQVVDVPGGFGFHEMALFHVPSRTLLLTDLVLNLEPDRVPPLMRPVVRLFGSLAPDGMPPPHVRALFKRGGAAARDAAERLIALEPERVVFAHGRWFERDGTAALRRSLRWLVG